MSIKELKNKKGFKILTNRYVLVLTLFVVWMTFFDTNSLLIHLELREEIRKLEKQKAFFHEEINQDKEILKKLFNPGELEKLARERYYMKKENEEIFLIEYEGD